MGRLALRRAVLASAAMGDSPFIDRFDGTLSAGWTSLIATAAAETNSGMVRGVTLALDDAIELLTNVEFTTDLTGWLVSTGVTANRRDFTTYPAGTPISPTGGADDFGVETSYNGVGGRAIYQSPALIPRATFKGTARAYNPSANSGFNASLQIYQTMNTVAHTIDANDTWVTLAPAAWTYNPDSVYLWQLSNLVTDDTAYWDKASFKVYRIPYALEHDYADGTITAQIVNPASDGAPFSLLVRASADGSAWWEIRAIPNIAGNDLFLIERQSNAESQCLAADVDWTAGGTDELRVVLQGTSIQLKTRKSGASDWTTQGTHTGATLNSTSRIHGWMLYDTGVGHLAEWRAEKKAL